MLTIGTRHFAAEAWRREYLAGIAEVPRVEGAAHVAKPTTMGELLDMTLSL